MRLASLSFAAQILAFLVLQRSWMREKGHPACASQCKIIASCRMFHCDVPFILSITLQAKARAILEELILLLIRLNNGLADGSFVHRWTLRQAFDAAAAAKGRPVEEAPAMGQKAAARMGLLCATVCVAVNVTNAMNEGTLSSLVLNTAVQVRDATCQLRCAGMV